MVYYDATKRYGIRLFQVRRHIGFDDEQPTEEEIRRNQVKKRDTELREDYNKECRRLINTLDDKNFLSDSQAYLISQISGEASKISPHRLEYDEENQEIPSLERIGNLRIRLADAFLTLSTDISTLKSLSRLLLTQSPKLSNPPEPDTPDIFYRIIRPDSYSQFDKKLGFRSSRQPFTLPSNHGGPLSERSLVDEDILRNHCEGNQPSDLIAMSDSPERILQFVKHPSFKDLEGYIIAVINVEKLRAMKVLFNRTTTLLKDWALRPGPALD